jgi:hypothetical protein
MRFSKENVRIDAIDTDDHFFFITTKKCTEALVDSIKSIGILRHPLLLRKKSSYRIVSGFRRIVALKSMGFSNVEALVIIDPLDECKIAKISISENSMQRPLNLIEKARSLKLLSIYINDMNELIDTAKSVGIPCDNDLAVKLLRICNLSDSIQEGLIDEFIAMPIALTLGRYDHDTANLFVDVFKQLRLGLNRQRELISLVTEIAFRDSIEPAQLMGEGYFAEVLNDNNIDRNQKSKLLRQHLMFIRFPEISKAKKTFKQTVKDLNITKGIKLIPPNNFEGRNYVFQLTFTRLMEIKSIITCLERITRDPRFENILNR